MPIIIPVCCIERELFINQKFVFTVNMLNVYSAQNYMRMKLYTTSCCYAFYYSNNAQTLTSCAIGQDITGTYQLPQIH